MKTRAQELDYPAGDKNVYTYLRRPGGVPIQSLPPEAPVRRPVRGHEDPPVQRHHRREPGDVPPRDRGAGEEGGSLHPVRPRSVPGASGRTGSLVWIIDGYTTSNKFPYSEPVRGLGNYIRNSVKAVVDAYNGTLAFYLSEPDDPVIKTYAKAFPGLFQPLSAMPADLRPHIRYPQGLFAIQARMFATYHMRDPQVFYNKEDLWNIPRRVVEGQEREIEPYYTIMRLPGEKAEEFILLSPFNPSKKDNMIAWMAARCDGPHYGKLIAYNFPKQKLIYGPRQIEARIDQDAFISQQLSLWSQRGSQVIRGSLLAIPIEQSLLYVQPLYLAAEKGSLPELKRVIVSMGNQIAMEENLEASLAQLFGAPGKTPGGGPRRGRRRGSPAPAQSETGVRGLADQALATVRAGPGVVAPGEFRRLRRGDQAAGRNVESACGNGRGRRREVPAMARAVRG